MKAQGKEHNRMNFLKAIIALFQSNSTEHTSSPPNYNVLIRSLGFHSHQAEMRHLNTLPLWWCQRKLSMKPRVLSILDGKLIPPSSLMVAAEKMQEAWTFPPTQPSNNEETYSFPDEMVSIRPSGIRTFTTHHPVVTKPSP